MLAGVIWPISPRHSGFGQMVIVRMAESAFNGTAEIEYRESGLFWRLTGAGANTLEPGGAIRSPRTQ
jgi:hypothetical protein